MIDSTGHIGQPVGILADDLTGAMDAAAPFAVRGLTSIISLGKVPKSLTPVLSISTETRDKASSDAESVRRALQSLQRLQSRALFQKVDSLLRGHFGDDLLTILDSCSEGTAAVVCPAFPQYGRIVRGGRLVTPNDPQGKDILNEIAADVHLVNQTSERLVSLALDHHRVVVADAACEADLESIVEAALHHDRPTILVGSAGLSRSLASSIVPESRATGRTESEPKRLSKDPVVVLVGSRNELSLRQLDALGSQLPVVELPLERMAEVGHWESLCRAAHALAVQGLAIFVGPGTNVTASDVELRLADLVECLFAMGVSGLVLTGGATARAALDRLHAEAIQVQDEIEPGVVLGIVQGGTADGLSIVTKSGGLGSLGAIGAATRRLMALRIRTQAQKEGS